MLFPFKLISVKLALLNELYTICYINIDAIIKLTNRLNGKWATEWKMSKSMNQQNAIKIIQVLFFNMQ